MMSRETTAPRTTAERIPVGDAWLDGDLVVPPAAIGLVIFAHGSGSGRRSPRNRQVAAALRGRGLATLLADLLTEAEERIDAYTAQYRFDIPRLALRLGGLVEWAATRPDLAALPMGLFGASTGAAAALIAAAQHPGRIAAVVSRGGRPDLAGEWLGRVRAPTRLIVGSLDQPVIGMNRAAMADLPGAVDLQIVDGATHLFEEPGTLERVADLAGEWYVRYLGAGAAPAAR
jgi:pimeloyl-ACP methyl ester carboxylesterase